MRTFGVVIIRVAMYFRRMVCKIENGVIQAPCCVVQVSFWFFVWDYMRCLETCEVSGEENRKLNFVPVQRRCSARGRSLASG